MQPPEPDGLAILAKWAGIAFAALGSLLGYHKMIDRKISAVDTKADGKATAADVDRVKNSIDVLFTLQREDKNAILASMDHAVARVSDEQHRNRDQILSAVGELTVALNNFREQVATELGHRPTRDEISAMHQASRRKS